MIGLIIFFIIVFLLALGFAWLADQPGSLLLVKVGGFEFAQENLAIIAAVALGIVLAAVLVWIVVTAIWKTPGRFGSFFKTRRREKGWQALAEGMIAVGAGDSATARKSAKNTAKLLPEEPVTKLLAAQAAQMDGKSLEARSAFEAMLEEPKTEVLGLRGLYMEAENAGETEAARHFVEKAAATQPGLEWSGNALLEMQAAEGDWEAALVTLHKNADAKLYDKKIAKRLRAVLLTALADQLEDGDPQKAKERALEAHRLAPDLVSAATIAARVLGRLGDLRKASKVIETSWKYEPHPELMDAYIHLRSGDSGLDRLKRAQSLNAIKVNHPEGIMGVTRAYIDLDDWAMARKTLTGLAGTAATERVCLMMSEIEEGQYGARGRVREWLSRAVRAPRDPVWMADGYIAETWAPVSPVSGRVDAFEWRNPSEASAVDDPLVLEEIPPGPIELPEVTDVDSTSSMIAAQVEDIVDVISPTPIKTKEKVEEISEIEGVKKAQNDQNSSMSENGEQDVERVSEDENFAPANENVAVAEEGIAHVSTEASEEETVLDAIDPEKPETVVDIDPINRRPIDDPGEKSEEEENPKRFRLF